MHDLWHELRCGSRSLVKKPGFVLLAVLPLALAIGANTTIFSLVDALLLRPMTGIEDASTLVEVRPMAGGHLGSLSYPDFVDLRRESRSLSDLAVWELETVALGGDGPHVSMAMIVSGNYFSLLGTRPDQGRFFLPEESFFPGVPPVAVLSHGLWQRQFGGDPTVVGSTVTMNGVPVTVVGVAPAGFRGHAAPLAAELWLPIGMPLPGMPEAAALNERESTIFDVLGRLAPGTAPASAAAELTKLCGELHKAGDARTIEVAPFGHLPSDARGPAAGFLAVLMVVVGLVMLIVCINVAGLLFARARDRSQELAVRLALGAERGRLVRQLLTETLTLFVLGGAGGVLLALWLTRLLGAVRPPLPPPLRIELDLGLDPRVLAFTLGLTLLTALVAGLLPAFRATRGDLLPALRREARSAGPRTSRWRGLLLGVQTAGTLLLLVAAGLFLRSLAEARGLDPGFTVDGVRLAALELDIENLDDAAGLAYFRSLLARVRAMPGTAAAAIAAKPPLASATRYGGVHPLGAESPPAGFVTDYNAVSPDYFDTLEIPLLAGRAFTDADGPGAPRVAVVNETFARRHWPGRSALGERFYVGPPEYERLYEVVGVARDVKYHFLHEETPAFVYVPIAQRHHSQVYLHWRVTPGGPSQAQVREVMRELDPAMPALATMELRENVDLRLLPQRLAASVAGVLGAAGLLLALVGLYGLTAYVVGARRHEIGVRMALGAGRRDVLRWLLGAALTAPLVGAVGGLGAAVLVTRFLEGFLYGLSPLDPVAYAGVLGIFAAVSLAGILGPARRALTTEPMTVLRND